MTISSAPGVFDILPEVANENWRSSYLWQHVESIIRETAMQFGFKEIRTPILEKTELFVRGVGDSSDIVSKEMYTLQDKGNRSLTLRPEGTAPVMRSFIENQLHTKSPIQKLFYIGPMFRYERSQAGRYRQHHQFGAECIGLANPEQDAELIDLLYTVYKRLGLNNLRVEINSIGTDECRKNFRQALIDYLKNYEEQLSEDSKRRLHTNPLRVLDSKDAKDKEIVKNAPLISDYLDTESQEHFQKVLETLDILEIPYTINPLLVRGLDYYNKTVFEITSTDLGAQNSVGGGGRYDGLLKTLGGPDLPTIGFGTGIERILQTMLKQNITLPTSEGPELFIIPLGENAKKKCLKITHALREANIPCDMDLSGKKLGKVMQYANQIKAKYTAVIGDNELEKQEVDLKCMESGQLLKVPFSSLKKILRLDLKNEEFIEVLQEINEPLENEYEVQFYMQKLQQKLHTTKQMLSSFMNTVDKIKGDL